MIRVQKEDFDIGIELSKVLKSNTEIGGISSFVGIVREYFGDDQIKTMTLEHYPGMTEKTLHDLEIKARNRWDIKDVLIVHRYGTLEPGDQIVLVVTASSHREDALESCQFLIDWLKTDAPFWKLENRKSGLHWVSARTTDTDAASRWVANTDD
ncbi:MAG: molybdenum cofactor biosynthesis protein MoaE [Pseudomonadota bacterium]|nr:molybdenum cofactor biosynthesis protein MoaE [Pseudomonadota bacterium]